MIQAFLKKIFLFIGVLLSIVKAQQVSIYKETNDFVEYYTSPLNTTRYKDYSTGYPVQFDQEYERWTWYHPPYLQVNQDLPGLFGQKGLKARLAQEQCKTQQNSCCTRTKCSNWAGSHLVSNSCFQFGVFEWEALINLSSDNDSRFFWALYVMRDSNMDDDTTWNEIDVGFGNGPSKGLYYSAAFFSPNLKMWRYSDTTSNKFTREFAESWHNYTLIWTPTSLTWLIDGKTYKSFTNTATIKVPWRCSSYRFILRTDSNVDTTASDNFIYMKRFQYKTLNTYYLETGNPLGEPNV
jgi:hypothetical protein